MLLTRRLELSSKKKGLMTQPYQTNSTEPRMFTTSRWPRRGYSRARLAGRAVWEMRGLEARGTDDQIHRPWVRSTGSAATCTLLASSRQHFPLPPSTDLKQTTISSTKLLLSLLVIIHSSAKVSKYLMQSPITAFITLFYKCLFTLFSPT